MSRSYANGISSIPLLGETIDENLQRTVEQFGGQEALVVCHQNKRMTYSELWDEVTACARGLLALGVGKGECVGIWSPNRYEWVIVQFATACIGAILVNVNPAYQAPELEYVIQQAGIKILIHSRSFRQTDYVRAIESVRPTCSSLQLTLLIDQDWHKLLHSGREIDHKELDQRRNSLNFDDPINIQYTSGTTGLPKGATLTHHNLLNNAFFTSEVLGYSELDRVCVPVPFYHCFGMVLGNLCCTSRGSCIVVPAEAFHAQATLDTIQKERCTSLYGVPTMFRSMLEVPDFEKYKTNSLRTGIMAGAPCPIELMQDVIQKLHMPEVVIGYGMTETSPISTMSSRFDNIDVRVSTVGRVFPHVEISIQNSNGQIVERGTPGELCTRGYSVMCGYWNNEEATRQSIDAGGWMHSGDLASMDELGYVRIVGRLKDMIIRGGENIYPAEIEAALHTHPDVSEAHIVGVPSQKYGEEVMAWVRIKVANSITEIELRSYCLERMAAFKVPKYWRFIDALPMTVTGKVQKYRLREMALEALAVELDLTK